jgi:hypothetical protein
VLERSLRAISVNLRLPVSLELTNKPGHCEHTSGPACLPVRSDMWNDPSRRCICRVSGRWAFYQLYLVPFFYLQSILMRMLREHATSEMRRVCASTSSWRTRMRLGIANEWLFAGLLASFCLIYVGWYPATISIEDESAILSTVYSIEHGSFFILDPRPKSGVWIGNHIISRYSVFHAALLVPAALLDWRLVFLVTASFFISGAFILRGILLRNGLGSEWCALYFLLAGALFYSQTIVAAVPAAVFGLLGVSLCLRVPTHPLLAGLCFGASVLLHDSMAPMAIVFSTVWCLEQGISRLRYNVTNLLVGALPAIAALAVYNYLTTGNPLKDVYILTGHQYQFRGSHLFSFFIFYVLSLAVFPIGGWSVFSREWSGTLTIPAVSAVTVTMMSFYFYREGLNVGSARVGSAIAMITGIVPGQRFLLPVSMIACLPAARFLNSRVITWRPERLRVAKLAALGMFTLLFSLLSAAHQSYLRVHFQIQQVLYEQLPPNARIVLSGTLQQGDAPDAPWPSEILVKEFLPTGNLYTHLIIPRAAYIPTPDVYIVFLTPPGQAPRDNLMRGRVVKLFKLRSWVWNRDLWIGSPARRPA